MNGLISIKKIHEKEENMNNTHHNHDWSGERAQKFVHSVEKLINYRYRPFAKEIVNAIRKYGVKENPKIVDIGAGPGILLIEIKKIFENCLLLGIDSSKSMLEIAENRVKVQNLKDFKFKLGTAEQIPIEKEQIDVVVCLNSLHDFNDAYQTIKEVSRILISGGFFILKDKNGAFPKWKMRLHFIPLIFRTGLKRTLKYFKSNELWLDPDQVIKWMAEFGIRTEEVHYKKDYFIIGKRE
jgi:ubiquinone/menaquinone biosynthesis C-methylase UbiE